LAPIQPLTLQQIAEGVNVKIEGPGGLDLAPALDFSTKDAIREGRDTKGV
jgi:hypothetical protein